MFIRRRILGGKKNSENGANHSLSLKQKHQRRKKNTKSNYKTLKAHYKQEDPITNSILAVSCDNLHENENGRLLTCT